MDRHPTTHLHAASGAAATQRRNCADIAGATGTTYKLDERRRRPTRPRRRHCDERRRHATARPPPRPTSSPRTPPVNTVLPTISGTARDGQTLTVDRGHLDRHAARSRTPTSGGAATRAAQLHRHRRRDRRDVPLTPPTSARPSASSSPRRTRPARRRDPPRRAVVARRRPGEHAPPDDLRHAARRPDADRRRRHLDRHADIAYAYQWRRCDATGANCADIAGATDRDVHAGRAPTSARRSRVVVTATNAAGSVAATSAATASVAPTPPVNTVAPTISGTARDGQTLTATTRHVDRHADDHYTYQWRRCDATAPSCTDIAARPARPTLTRADVANTIRVVVTATNAAGNASATTAASEDRRAPPVNTAVPTSPARARDGSTLTADEGTWTGPPTITYAYQWRRCDTAGANCVDIASAPADVRARRARTSGRRRAWSSPRRTPPARRARRAPRPRRRPLSPRSTRPPRRSPARPATARSSARSRQLDRHADDHLRLPVEQYEN